MNQNPLIRTNMDQLIINATIGYTQRARLGVLQRLYVSMKISIMP